MNLTARQTIWRAPDGSPVLAKQAKLRFLPSYYTHYVSIHIHKHAHSDTCKWYSMINTKIHKSCEFLPEWSNVSRVVGCILRYSGASHMPYNHNNLSSLHNRNLVSQKNVSNAILHFWFRIKETQMIAFEKEPTSKCTGRSVQICSAPCWGRIAVLFNTTTYGLEMSIIV